MRTTADSNQPVVVSEHVQNSDDDDYDEPFACGGQPSPPLAILRRETVSSGERADGSVGFLKGTKSVSGTYSQCVGPSDSFRLHQPGSAAASMTLPSKPPRLPRTKVSLKNVCIGVVLSAFDNLT